jgi:hypothetical protein
MTRLRRACVAVSPYAATACRRLAHGWKVSLRHPLNVDEPSLRMAKLRRNAKLSLRLDQWQQPRVFKSSRAMTNA